MVRSLLIALCFFAAPVLAETPASEDTVLELLEITRSRDLIENLRPQMEAMTHQAVAAAVDLSALSAKQQKILDEMQREMIALYVEDMAWERMEPEFVAIYRDAFTEEELRGMIDFYATEAGQAVIRKMPRVMEQSMGMVGRQMQRLAPRMEEIQSRTIERMKTAARPRRSEGE